MLANKRSEEPRSRLHRLLKKADEALLLTNPAALGNQSFVTAKQKKFRTGEASPVRPVAPDAPTPPPTQMTPQPRATQSANAVGNTVQERLEAEAALENIRYKMAQAATEFDKGVLNRAQFNAMYARYREQREVIERLLARDPGTLAWQQVAREGHTAFLKQQFEARVLFYAIYDYGTLSPIITQGGFTPPPDVIKNMLMALSVLRKNHDKPPVGRKQIDGGRWIVLVPGQHTAAVTMFSLEPSTRQLLLVQDLHRDFERANRILLARGIRVPDQLVFPHRALFERATQTQ